ncbi:MAG: transglycosylase family protein [Streptosporangiaceae bacterium]
MAVTISLHPAVAKQDSGYISVKSGDTLSSISQKVYGKSTDWPALWWANRHSVPNPSEIRVGQRLRLVSKPSAKQLAQETEAATGASPHAAAPSAAPYAAPVTSEAPAYAESADYSGSGGFQSCVIRAESGGDAGAVNPDTGAGGLYGFLPSTWQALGYSGLPEDASVAEQNAAYEKEYSESGSSAWAAYDGC